jgi:hypothetical protein
MLGKNRSGLIIGLEPMSMCCVACEKNISHHPEICSKNYKGSLARGMEATRATTLVVRLSSDNLVYIGDFVSDDDASSRAVLEHLVEDLIKVGTMTKEEEWHKETGQWTMDRY